MRTRYLLAPLLAASYAVRLWLAHLGGQDFWPDEARYNSARGAAQAVVQGRARDALVELFGHADHVLFRPAMLPVALVEHWAGGAHPVLVASYLSLFSVGAIFLIWAVARRAGAPESEALWAALLAAASNSLFLYARFYLPYDIALFVLMGALWLALGRASAATSLMTGVAAGLGFLAYNGYWLLGGAVLILHTLLGAGGRKRILTRGAWAGAGLVLSVAAVVGIGVALAGGLGAAYGTFAGTVKQGDFHLGYRVILEYLWYTERGAALVALAGLAYAVFAGLPGGLSGRLGWWLGGAALVVGGLVLFSDVVPVFMVYGRLTRSAVPFACLGAAVGIDRFIGSRGRAERAWAAAAALLIAVLAAWNFSASLRQVFPAGFQRMATRTIEAGSSAGFSFHRMLFAENLWGRPLHYSLPPHRDLLRSAHPMQFRPFQYEGYSAAQRAELNGSDIAMRLVEFDTRFSGPAQAWDGYPGPVRLRMTFGSGDWSHTEPLIASGLTGVGDILLVRYLDPGHLAFGLDHWGSALLMSDPVPVDLSRPHELLISTGDLLPPAGSACYATSPELAGLRRYALVELDGRVVLSRRAEFFASTPKTIYFGSDVIGGSTASGDFTGFVSEFGPAPTEEIVRIAPSSACSEIARHRAAEWAGAVGPLHLQFALPAPGAGLFAGQPLLAIGGPSSSDVLYTVRDGDGTYRVCYDSRGRRLLQSDPIRPAASGVEEMDVCAGSMLPAAGAPVYARVPDFVWMRGRLQVRVNGQLALSEERPFEPVGAQWMALAENTVESSACGAYFQGNMEPVRAIGPENVPSFGSRLSDLLANPDARWGGFTGPLWLRLRFPAGVAGRSEPLLVSGAPGAADSFVVRYEGADRVRFGFEHSGAAALLSEPVEVRPGVDHEVLLSAGALMPPGDSGVYRDAPELLRLMSIVEVTVDGKPVLLGLQAPHPIAGNPVEVGANLLGRARCGSQFHGQIDGLRVAGPLEPLSAGAIDTRLAREGWDGYPGPLRMTLTVPQRRPGMGQPLLTTGYPGGGDFIYLSQEAGGAVRVIQDHWGSALARSEPIALEPGTEHTVALSFGALFPPAGAALYRRHPEYLKLRDRVTVSVDGRTILDAAQLSHPTPPDRITVGTNLIGGSNAGPLFAGTIANLAPAALPP